MTQVFLTSPTGSNQTYTSDATWDNSDNFIDCIGAGGSGSAVQRGTNKPSGGGGGAWSRIVDFSFATPGTTTATYQIGTGGAGVSGGAVGVAGAVAGNAGGDTWFNATTFASASVGAKGGSGAPTPAGSGTGDASTGGAGGLASARPNSANTSGNNGGTGGFVQSGFTGAYGRGGGGAGGPNGAGNDGGFSGGINSYLPGGSGDAGSGGAGGTSANAGSETAGGAGTEYQASPARGSGGGGGGCAGGVNATITGLGAGGAFGGGSGSVQNQGSGGNKSTLATSAAGGNGLIVLQWTPVEVQAPFKQDKWPVPIGPEYHAQLKTWAWNYNLNLIGQDKLPAGQVSNVVPIGPIYHVQLRTWTVGPKPEEVQAPPFKQTDWPLPRGYQPLLQTWVESYNLSLIGQDLFPAGDEIFDLPPKGYPEPATRTWTFTFNPNLVGQDRLPVGEQSLALTPKPYEYANFLRAWTWSYNLNLIGQDFLPAGKELYDLPPTGNIYPVSLRSWISYLTPIFTPQPAPFVETDWPLPGRAAPIQQSWTFNLLLSTLLPLPEGEQYYDLAPRGYPEPATRTWTWNYNLNLISQDALPVGKEWYDLPPIGYTYPAQLRTWVSFAPPTPVVTFPFAQTDWPAPRGPLLPQRSWVASYNLNLIGQDAMTVGEQVYDLAPIAQPQTLPRSWTLNLQQTTLQPIPCGEQVYDRPPRGPIQPIREWSESYNLNLIGQDALPVGENISALPPQPALSAAQLRTWINAVNLALITPSGAKPFSQTDWPLNFGPIQTVRTFTTSYNPNLIGKDALPTGEQIIELAPRLPSGAAYPPSLRFWAPNNTILQPVGQMPVGASIYALPTGSFYPSSLRTGIGTPGPGMFPPAPTAGFPRNIPFIATMGAMTAR